MAITALNGERNRSRARRSPRPSPRAVPPVAAKGTSDPSCNAIARRSVRASLRPCSTSRAAMAAAASALPPPNPACAGMRLVSEKRAPPGNDSSCETSRAARSTRLSAPAGTSEAAGRASLPRTAACSWRTASVKPRGRHSAVSVSKSVTDWNTVTRSWNPSARCGPTARPRLSLARASTVTERRRGGAGRVREARGRAAALAVLRARLTARRTAPSTRAPRTARSWPGWAGPSA